MSNYILSCSSTADLSQEHFKNRDISYICFHYELDGKQYMDDLGKTMPFDKFYEAMANGADTKTSQINVDEYSNYFEKFLQDGKDILHLSLSSGISGTVLNAVSIFSRLSSFINGVFDFRAIVYFLSVIGIFLFLTVQALEKRRWNG